MKIHIAVIAMTLATACVVTKKPVVQACRAVAPSKGDLSEGSFTVLPSLVPGVEITNASWRVRVEKDVVPVELLTFSTTIHGSRQIPQDEIALVYDAPGPHALVDATLLQEGVTEYKLGHSAPLLQAGSSKTIRQSRDIGNASWFSRTSTLAYCPQTVQIVPLGSVALALQPDLITPGGQAARLAGYSGGRTPSLAIVLDTLVEDGPGGQLMVGAAVNTTDSTLHDMVVGLAFSTDSILSKRENPSQSLDTLEYFIGSIAPHQTAAFAGGQLTGDERIVSRVTYRSMDVGSRPIAGARELHRASGAARRTSLGASRRAD